MNLALAAAARNLKTAADEDRKNSSNKDNKNGTRKRPVFTN